MNDYQENLKKKMNEYVHLIYKIAKKISERRIIRNHFSVKKIGIVYHS